MKFKKNPISFQAEENKLSEKQNKKHIKKQRNQAGLECLHSKRNWKKEAKYPNSQ